MSMRSPQWFIPKFMFGKPADELGTLTNGLPTKLRQIILTGLLKLMQGSYKKYGLPVPKELVLNQHPTSNSDLLDYIRHGRIKPRPAIKAFNGNEVIFSDDSSETFDTIVALIFASHFLIKASLILKANIKSLYTKKCFMLNIRTYILLACFNL